MRLRELECRVFRPREFQLQFRGADIALDLLATRKTAAPRYEA
jgi:hypothetical protein